nr:molybdate ABC transporter substrate-binding protein [Phaeobacter marinintestinus]
MVPVFRLFSLLALTASLASVALADNVTVFAAASLKNAMDDVAQAYEAQSGDDVVVSFGGSSALARQIQQGAPADLFISANPGWMDVLEEDGLIVPGTRLDLLSNTLVLIGSDPRVLTISPDLDLVAALKGERLAMALVDAVPAGIYGKAALISLGIWSELAPHIAQTDNVRAALRLVALGEAPLGIVYATDALADPNVYILDSFPANSHPPIRYPVAVVSEGRQTASRRFLDYLTSDSARVVFDRYGFGAAGIPQ